MRKQCIIVLYVKHSRKALEKEKEKELDITFPLFQMCQIKYCPVNVISIFIGENSLRLLWKPIENRLYIYCNKFTGCH